MDLELRDTCVKIYTNIISKGQQDKNGTLTHRTAYVRACSSIRVVELVFMTTELRREPSRCDWVLQSDGKVNKAEVWTEIQKSDRSGGGGSRLEYLQRLVDGIRVPVCGEGSVASSALGLACGRSRWHWRSGSGTKLGGHSSQTGSRSFA